MKYNAKKSGKSVPDKDRAAKEEQLLADTQDGWIAPWEKTPGKQYQAAEACESTPFFAPPSRRKG